MNSASYPIVWQAPDKIIRKDNLFREVSNPACLEQFAPRGMTAESSCIAFFLLSQGCYIDCNEQATRLLQRERNALLNQSPCLFSPAEQPDGQSSSARFLQIVATAEAGVHQNFEWQHERNDGVLVDVEVMIAPIFRDGKTFLLATVRDISDCKRALAELAASHERLRWLNQVSTRLHGNRSASEVAWESVSILADHSSAPRVSFFLIHHDTDELEVLASIDRQERTQTIIGARHPYTRHESFENVDESDVYYITDFASAPVPESIKAQVLARGICSTATIWLGQGDIKLGMISLEYSTTAALALAERDDLAAFGKTASMALVNAHHLADIQFQATHDALTDLPNRVVLHRDVPALFEQVGARGEMLALMLLDLDRFKEINDTLGHHVGDLLLRDIGPRLRQVLGAQGHLLCRLGGDEFAIAVGVADVEAAKQLAKQLLNVLKEPFRLVGTSLEIGGSIGIAMGPNDNLDSHVLLRYADVAMYAAKRGGNGFTVYTAQMDQHSPDRLALLNELGLAIRTNQLVLHYQPKIHLDSGRIVGFEALVRWQHPRRGLLMPDTFVPLAEMGEAIGPLTLEVVRMALIQQQQWRLSGLPYHVAVNLSARNLIDADCITELKHLIEQFQVEPGSLEFEITETAIMSDPDTAASSLRSLVELGVRLSIDDFGTGYSSLSHLNRLPIHALKIDRSFVKDMVSNPQDAVIVTSIINLAHSLNLHVVAEGVEDLATLALLQERGCDLAQGYYIGRPAAPLAPFELQGSALAERCTST